MLKPPGFPNGEPESLYVCDSSQISRYHIQNSFQTVNHTNRKRAMGTGWKGPQEPVFQPVPQNRDPWSLSRTPGILTGALLGNPLMLPHCKRVVPMSFPLFSGIQFYVFCLLLFIVSELIRVPVLYCTIRPLVVFEFKEYSKITKSQRQTYN